LVKVEEEIEQTKNERELKNKGKTFGIPQRKHLYMGLIGTHN
jgi:hypothetical protein